MKHKQRKYINNLSHTVLSNIMKNMRFKIILLIFILICNFPPITPAQETGVLYLWEISSGKLWKSFGDDSSQQKYKGEIINGIPDGLGITNYPDGTKYMGQWKEGLRHGQGTLTLADGEKLTGEWKDNKEWNVSIFDTKGRIKDLIVDGVKLINNKKDGVLFYRQEQGIWGWHKTAVQENGYQYAGQIENKKPNGWGIFTYPSGNIFEGEFKEGLSHGQGTFSLADGKISKGEFKDNKPWNVTEYDLDGNIIGKYTAGVKTVENKLTGILFTRKEDGKWIWFEKSDSYQDRKYEGEIENGKPQGKGSLTYLNGTKYVGEFLEGTWHGQGTFTFPDGETWVGEFRKDAPWNITWHDNNGKIVARWGNGVKEK